AEAGNWTLGYVSLRDQAGNYTNVYQPTLTMLGLSASFQVTSTDVAPPAGGSIDGLAPVLASLAVGPASVDVSTGSASVTVTATITDDLSGFSSGYINFSGPSGRNNASGSFVHTSGNQYIALVSIPRFAESGTWKPSSSYLTDKAGNYRNLSATDLAQPGIATSFIVGLVPSIDSKPTSLTASSAASFTFSASLPNVSFTCALDSNPPAACASTVSYSGLADGSHALVIRASDPNGNAASTSYSWTVDATPPVVSFTGVPSVTTTARSGSFSFSSNESGSTYECAFDLNSFSACSSPKLFSGLLPGKHSFSVRTTDRAGNSSTAADVWTIEADTTAPVIAITSSPSGTTTSRVASVFFRSDDPGATYSCRLDTETPTPCASPASYVGLADGTHHLSVMATDDWGNAATAVTPSWSVDTTAPILSITSRPTDPSTSPDATFAFASNEPT